MPHALIVGAGPAGCAAAILLARGRWRVTLVEQHRFPRQKVCGECISSLGIDVLDRLGLLQAVRGCGAVELRSCQIHCDGEPTVILQLPRPMVGLSRQSLDACLLRLAVDSGANLLEPARCEGIDLRPDSVSASGLGVPGPRVRVRDLVSNTVQTLAPDCVVMADGKSATGLKMPSATGDLGFKTHFAGVDAASDAIQLYGCEGCYGGLAPIEDGCWNLAFSVPAQWAARCRGDLELLSRRLLQGNADLASRLAGARRICPWLVAPLPRFGVAPAWPERIVPIGNAAAAVEPIGGEGIGLALRSAELAACMLLAKGPALDARSVGTLRAQYRRLWTTRRLGCRAAACIISSPWTSQLVPISSNKLLSRALLAIMGKS